MSSKGDDNKQNIPPYLNPENVFPFFPQDQEQQMADLYSEYFKHYTQSLNKVSFLNEIMNIREGLVKKRDRLENDYERDFEDVKELISQSSLSDDRKTEFQEELKIYLVSYSYGDYLLDEYEKIASMISEYVFSRLEIISNHAQIEFITSLFTDLIRSVDKITRVIDHVLLLDVIIDDVGVTGYKVELLDHMTPEQKKRLNLQENNEPPSPAQNKQWIINTWNDLRPNYPEKNGDSACARAVKKIYEKIFEPGTISEPHIKKLCIKRYNY